MTISRVKVWVDPEALISADLNGEINNILNNLAAEILAVIAANSVDLNGLELVLDADGDTSITADTDDQIDFKIGGTDRFVMTSAALDLNALELILDADADTSVTSDTDDRIDCKAGGVDIVRLDGTTASSVNGFDLKSAATGNAPAVIAQGSDTNIDLEVTPKGSGELTVGGVQVFKATTSGNSSDQEVTSGTEADITGATALTLPTTSSVSGKTFEVTYYVCILEGAAASNFTAVKAYSGADGDKDDTLISNSASGQTLPASGFGNFAKTFRFSPADDAHVKIGLTAAALSGTVTVKGTSGLLVTVKITEVPA